MSSLEFTTVVEWTVGVEYAKAVSHLLGEITELGNLDVEICDSQHILVVSTESPTDIAAHICRIGQKLDIKAPASVRSVYIESRMASSFDCGGGALVIDFRNGKVFEADLHNIIAGFLDNGVGIDTASTRAIEDYIRNNSEE